jgi:hypothetical protein
LGGNVSEMSEEWDAGWFAPGQGFQISS